MTAQLNGRWDAARFFEELTATNRLAKAEGFTFCRVSGLDGFEEAVNEAQTQTAFVCVSDIADGYTELNNTPRTRRVKTVFFAMRHAAEDMAARAECMETMRELFRQFMSRLLPEKVRLVQNCIYLDPRITFNEIDRYFFSGAAGAYFQIAVDVFTDLRFNADEWEISYDVWLISAGSNKIQTIKTVKDTCGYDLKEAKKIVDSVPAILKENITKYKADKFCNIFHGQDAGATLEIRPHG